MSFIKDKTSIIKKINALQLINFINVKEVSIPIFQRELQEDKILSIIEEFINGNKNGENYFIKHGFTISLCKLKGKMYMIDGQHRYEALKRVFQTDYNPDIILRIQECETLQQVKKDFSLLNSNSKIPIVYKEMKDQYLQDSILNLKAMIKKNYKNSFNKNKIPNKTNRIHFDTFLEMLEPMKIKQFYEKNDIDIGDNLFLYNKLLKINEKVYNYINDNSFYVNKIDQKNIDKYKFCLSLQNVKWTSKLFENGNIIYKPINYKKKNIPSSVRRDIFNRDFNGKYKGNCYVCEKVIDRDNSHIGHIIPEHKGGKCVLSNLKAICISCNLSMNVRNMEEFKNDYYVNVVC